MFGKVDLVDSLSRDIARTRDKRDSLASDVTMLTSRIWRLVSPQKTNDASASALQARSRASKSE